MFSPSRFPYERGPIRRSQPNAATAEEASRTSVLRWNSRESSPRQGVSLLTKRPNRPAEARRRRRGRRASFSGTVLAHRVPAVVALKRRYATARGDARSFTSAYRTRRRSEDLPRFFSSPRVGFVRACRVRAGVRGGVTGSLGAKKTFAFPKCNKTKGRPR